MVKCLENGIVPNVILPDGHDTIDLELEYNPDENCNNKSNEVNEISKCLHNGIIPKIYKDKIASIEKKKKKVLVEKKQSNTEYGTQDKMI